VTAAAGGVATAAVWLAVSLPLVGATASATSVPPQDSAAEHPGAPIPLADVEAFAIEGGGEASVTVGSPAELVITGPAAATEQLSVTVTGGELEIGPDPRFEDVAGVGDGVHYHIVVEHLAEVSLRGAIRLQLDGLVGEAVDLDLAGASAATVSGVATAQLGVDLGDEAHLVVTGTTEELTVDAREGSAFDGSGLVAASGEVDAQDTARAVVNVSGSLEAEARDAAIVEHVGAPGATDFEVRETGAIRPATGTLLADLSPPPTAAGSEVAGTPGETPPPAADPAATTTHTVSLAGRTFTPGVLEISVGDEVTWVNDDDSDHTVSSVDGVFDSGELPEGASFSFVFDTAGEYPYLCFIHPEMQGTIIVS
jgi:plastocyanin